MNENKLPALLKEFGNPTPEALMAISGWRHDDFAGLMEYIKPAFIAINGFNEDDYYYFLSTFGWSGHVEIIKAITENKAIFGRHVDLECPGGVWVFRKSAEFMGLIDRYLHLSRVVGFMTKLHPVSDDPLMSNAVLSDEGFRETSRDVVLKMSDGELVIGAKISWHPNGKPSAKTWEFRECDLGSSRNVIGWYDISHMQKR